MRKVACPSSRHKPRRVFTARVRAACIGTAFGLAAACAAQEPLLNSERIEASYGNYAIEVVEANGNHRIANLYSVRDGTRTTRTWAEVTFVSPVDRALREEHDLVLAGGSIGEVFKSRGWTVSRRDIRIGSDVLDSSGRQIAALMHIDTPSEVGLHEYALLVAKDRRTYVYAVITERHHPDYLTRRDLEGIYGGVSKTAK